MPKTDKTAMTAEENGQEAASATEQKEPQKTAEANDTEQRFVYIGPTTNTGLFENTIFAGDMEKIEKYLEPTLEKIPQVKRLLVTTEDLAGCRRKVKTTGTLLNKYYNDILGIVRKKED